MLFFSVLRCDLSFRSINAMCRTDGLACAEPPWHPGDKSHAIACCRIRSASESRRSCAPAAIGDVGQGQIPCDHVLLNSVGQRVTEELCARGHRRCGPAGLRRGGVLVCVSISAMPTLWRESACSLLFALFFWKRLRRTGILIFYTFGKVHSWSHWVLGISVRFLVPDSVSLLVIGLFRFPISSCFSLGRLYVSKNFSIYSRFSRLSAYRCS